MMQSSQPSVNPLALQCQPSAYSAQQQQLRVLDQAPDQFQISCALSAVEALIVRNEVSAPHVSWLSDAARWEELLRVWSDVKLITGGVVYAGDEERTRQFEVLEMFILSNPKFSRLTAPEIKHAFLMNAQGEFADQVPSGSGTMFRHYNKELNAEFVGDVLSAYVRKKQRMYSRKHDDIVRALQLIEAPAAPKITNEDWQREIQGDYDKFQAGLVDWIFNTTPKYWMLRKFDLLFYSSRDKWQAWYRDALRRRADQARRQLPDTFGKRIAQDNALSMYDAIAKSGMIQRSEHLSVMHEMRRAVYLKFFEIIQEWGIKNIFTEIAFKTPKAHA